MFISSDTARIILHFVQTKRAGVAQGHLRIIQKDRVMLAGRVTWVKCRVPPQLDPSDSLVLFEPQEGCV